LREAIENGVTGFLFPPGDATALTDHMQRLLDDPQLRGRLGAQARARVAAGFTSGIQLRNLVNLVGQLTR
jgi:glycosyltransferase involved in cell wall biosynthesis